MVDFYSSAPFDLLHLDYTDVFDANVEGWEDTNQIIEILGKRNSLENQYHIIFFALKAYIVKI